MEEVSENMESKNQINKEIEIDFKEIWIAVWAKRKRILVNSFIVVLIGIVYSLVLRNEFQTSCNLIPESSETGKSNFGGLGDLVGLSGINLSSASSGSLSPELYPQIANSAPFLLEIINSNVRFSNGSGTVYSYFYDHLDPTYFEIFYRYTIGLVGRIKNKDDANSKIGFEKDRILELSKKEEELIEKLRKRIEINMNPESGILMVKVKMPDPLVCAELTYLVVETLTEKVTKYKIEKAQVTYNFVEGQYQKAKERYLKDEEKLAEFADSNLNLSGARVQTKYKSLQNELNISFEVFKGLATQLEQSKLKIQEETPVFTVLEPVKYPLEKFEPHRKIIIVSFLFIGFILSSVYIIVKDYLLK